MEPIIYSPGETVPDSGIYVQVDLDGNDTPHDATCVKGEPFPPTQQEGFRWKARRLTHAE